jgi:hypothetical protein
MNVILMTIMSDCCDDAQAVEEIALKVALSHRRTSMRAVGNCYNCGDECHGVFCSSECSEDFESRANARKRNG